jgi:DNA invertase Pin-like site-specific DNA recombinase
MRKAAIYLRVSTQDQTTTNQERELRAVAERMGIEIAKVYRDHGISGAKGRDKRPDFDRLCKDAARRQFDIVMAWSVDRLGRSLQDLVGFLSEIHSLKIDLYLHQQGLDTTTPAGKAMFQMMGVFADYADTAVMRSAGLRRAKETGTKSGRPIGRPTIDPALEVSIRDSLARGVSYRVTAETCGVALGTVQRIAAASRPFGGVEGAVA